MQLDPVWISAVQVLLPYVQKVGEKVAEKIGETLFERLKQRFQKDKDEKGEQVLKHFQADPEIYSPSLQAYLQKRAADQAFQQWLREEIRQAAGMGEGPAVGGRDQVDIQIHDSQVGNVIGVNYGDVRQQGLSPVEPKQPRKQAKKR